MSDIDPAVMELGQQSYPLCMACHGANGEGMPNLGPPLAGSEWVLGPAENLIRMQFRGLMGPITVKGEEWNSVMAANAPVLQTDEKIAAVLTYIRNSWGNSAPAVTPDEVAKYRDELGQPMLTVADL
ncbi:MAG: cytochrome c, partial [Verrucomicrobiota bacterium]